MDPVLDGFFGFKEIMKLRGGLYGKTGMKTPGAKGNCSGYICTSRCVSYEHVSQKAQT